MTGELPSQWSKWLPLAEWWYNSTFHSSLNMTPFEALFGYKPTPLPLGPYLDSVVPTVTDMVQERSRISSYIKEHLAKAQQRMKHYADQHRTERSFSEGDWVFLKLQPYRQQTVAVRKCLKLAAKYYRPFQVEEKVGAMAYKLKLPADARIHHVFHVSLLKKKLGPLQYSSPKLLELDDCDQCPLRPEAILKRRAILREGRTVIQFLIKWNHLGYDEASWEDKSFIENQFPEFQT